MFLLYYPFDFAFFTRKTPRRSTVTVILEILTAPWVSHHIHKHDIFCFRDNLHARHGSWHDSFCKEKSDCFCHGCHLPTEAAYDGPHPPEQ
jgi:hypothetical protein